MTHNLKNLLEELKSEDRILIDYLEDCQVRRQEGRPCLIANTFVVLLDQAANQENTDPFQNVLKDLVPIEYQFIKRVGWCWNNNVYQRFVNF